MIQLDESKWVDPRRVVCVEEVLNPTTGAFEHSLVRIMGGGVSPHRSSRRAAAIAADIAKAEHPPKAEGERDQLDATRHATMQAGYLSQRHLGERLYREGRNLGILRSLSYRAAGDDYLVDVESTTGALWSLKPTDLVGVPFR